ncbi:hypothetical protein V6N13_039174 [Hibiscus sabdariffa]
MGLKSIHSSDYKPRASVKKSSDGKISGVQATRNRGRDEIEWKIKSQSCYFDNSHFPVGSFLLGYRFRDLMISGAPFFELSDGESICTWC